MPVYRALDRLDYHLCRHGLTKAAAWNDLEGDSALRLYAGRLYRGAPQYRSFFGLTPFRPSLRNIPHDVLQPMPLPDCCVDIYQSEDVFEHLPYDKLPDVLDEIYRVLKVGGLFRLSMPDYGCDVYASRSETDEAGHIVFDPVGGGRLEDKKVVGGGHLWFPTYESVKELFVGTRFSKSGSIRFLHYFRSDGKFVLEKIDYSLGYVKRTPDHDSRVNSPRRPLSIVVDAVKG